MATLAELYAIDDPRKLFLLATEAINQRREDVDEIAAIRAGAIAALYAQGYSYKELADTLGMSAPRVGQLVAANDAAAIEVLRSWVAIEERLNEVAQLADPSGSGTISSSQRSALQALASSGSFDRQALLDLDSIRQVRNHLVHGRAEVDTETAEAILDKAIYLNALLTIWINNKRSRSVEAVTERLTLATSSSARQKLANLQKDEATLRKRLGDASASAARSRQTAAAKRQQASRTSSSSMQRSYLNSATTAEKKAASEEKKTADISKKLAEVSKRMVVATKELERAEKEIGRTDAKRRNVERLHAQEIARISTQTAQNLREVRSIRPPKPEKLRVLYLASNPDSDAYLRVDVEVREVRQAVKKAINRDLIEIDHWPAATPEDLLDGLSEQRPHVVHFAGHGDGFSLLFDDAKVEDSSGRAVSFDTLARALSAVDTPPNVLVLNSCDTLNGAEVLLDSVPVVIAMASTISDLAATVFAARFYATIANSHSVQSAVNQGSVAIDMLEGREGWKPAILAREDVDVSTLVLVQPIAAD